MIIFRRNVLIFHLGALGDFVVTWPLAMALARLYPQSRVRYVTHAQKGALGERALRVESLDVEGGWHHLFGPGAPGLPEPCTRALMGAHTVISFVSDGSDAWAQNVCRLSPSVDLVCLKSRPLEPYEGHISDFVLDQMTPHKALAEGTRQMIRLISSRGLGKLPEAVSVLIHPGSGGRDKRWPVGRFIELARQLTSQGVATRFVIGEVEQETWDAADLNALAHTAQVVTPATLVELCAVLESATHFCGNDSGPAHLAAALGLRSVVLFGPSSSRLWRPVGRDVHVLEPMADVTPDQVRAALALG